MVDAKALLFCYVLRIILCIGTEIVAEDIYTNIWAVKVRGSIQEAKQLAFKHGFSFDKHVSLGCVSLGKSEIGFLIQDHMDSFRPTKRKIRFRIIFVTSHEIMLIYETMNRATKC